MLNLAGVHMHKKFNCEECQSRQMRSWNCDGTKEKTNRIPIVPSVPIMYVKRCPVALLQDNIEAYELWDVYTTWKILKVLPSVGGTDDQETAIIQALQHIEHQVGRIESDKKYGKWKSKKSEDSDKHESLEEKQYTSFRDVSRSRGKK